MCALFAESNRSPGHNAQTHNGQCTKRQQLVFGCWYSYLVRYITYSSTVLNKYAGRSIQQFDFECLFFDSDFRVKFKLKVKHRVRDTQTCIL